MTNANKAPYLLLPWSLILVWLAVFNAIDGNEPKVLFLSSTAALMLTGALVARVFQRWQALAVTLLLFVSLLLLAGFPGRLDLPAELDADAVNILVRAGKQPTLEGREADLGRAAVYRAMARDSRQSNLAYALLLLNCSIGCVWHMRRVILGKLTLIRPPDVKVQTPPIPAGRRGD